LYFFNLGIILINRSLKLKKNEKKKNGHHSYGFGIIGAGKVAGLHATALSEIENVDVVAVYDIIPGKAASFTEVYGGRPYDDIKKFLKDTDVEFVSITTPSGLHQDVAIEAARAGKHIIIEKPFEITVERCRNIINAAAENNVLLSGISQSRFFDASIEIKKALDKKRFGELILCNAYVKWYRHQDYYDSTPWRGTKEIAGGGALMNQAIYALDLLLWFGGDVREVNAVSTVRGHQRIEVEDLLVSTLVFENGAFGALEATTNIWPGAPKRIEILGTHGSAVVEENNIVRWSFLKETPEDEIIRSQYGVVSLPGASLNPLSISYEGHQRQFVDCINAVENGREPLVDGEEAAKVIALIQAIYQSAEEKNPVILN
jgi:predicted dehydrogenase